MISPKILLNIPVILFYSFSKVVLQALNSSSTLSTRLDLWHFHFRTFSFYHSVLFGFVKCRAKAQYSGFMRLSVWHDVPSTAAGISDKPTKNELSRQTLNKKMSAAADALGMGKISVPKNNWIFSRFDYFATISFSTQHERNINTFHSHVLTNHPWSCSITNTIKWWNRSSRSSHNKETF